MSNRYLRRRGLFFCTLSVATLHLACDAKAATAWSTLGGNAQHTGLSTSPAQSLDGIHWSAPVDLGPAGNLIHFGSPIITASNTVLIPIRTAAGGYRLDARSGGDGTLIWTANTDYIVPPHNWIPSYSPALSAGNRLYFPGAGGTVYVRDNADSAAGTIGQLAFYGLSAYQASPAAFNSSVFINTPITVDASGTIYFGFRVNGSAPLGLKDGIARIDAAGNGSWITASAVSGDNTITRVPHQAAPALSNDGQTLYVVVASALGMNAYLLGLDPATLALKQVQPGVPMRALLEDPRNGSPALVFDDSSASPMVGPDGDVYYGVQGNPFNGSRGWLLHFSLDLTVTKTPGAFGWDNTAGVVPASAVPSYSGNSSYLIFSKYNNYAGTDNGNGVNKIAVLDPNAAMVEPHPSSNGLSVMKEVQTIAGPTPDPEWTGQFPNAVKEWCLNAAAVDPFTKSIFANSEDGKLYRWNLAGNTLSQAVTLSPGVGEAYTPPAIGPDGTVYAINWAILNAVGVQGAPSLTSVASRKQHGASGPLFDLTLASTPNNPTTEPRSGGASGRHTVVFTFDKPVASGTASITAGMAFAGPPTFSGYEMRVPLNSVANAQYVTVAVSNVAPVGGGATTNASVRVGFLAGDANASRAVTLSDMLAVDAVLAQPVTSANFLRDVNASGTLTLSDLLFVNAFLTQTLPPP